MSDTVGRGKLSLTLSSLPSTFYKLLFLVLPLSIFIFPKLDLWVSAGLFFQLGIYGLFILSFLQRVGHPLPRNIPFYVLSIWLVLQTALVFHGSARQNFYNHLNIYAFLNYLTFLLFYRATCESISGSDVKRILCYMAYGVTFVCLYSLVQALNLDEFMDPLATDYDRSTWYKADYLVGTLGNPSHLAGYLGICLPLFYIREGKRWFILGCLAWLIIALSGSTSGLITGISSTAFFAVFRRMKVFVPVIVGIAFFSVIFLFRGYDFRNAVIQYTNLSGRIEVWKTVGDTWRKKPLLGHGLGYMRFMRLVDKTKTTWSHAHNEYLQGLLELGLIGVGLVLWCLWDYFRVYFSMVKSNEAVCLASMMTGFLANSMFNFPMHLWIISSLGMASYSLIYVLKCEEEYGYAKE